MRVLLIQPPHYYGNESRPPSDMPLGIGYLDSVLTHLGHEVEILDIWACQWDYERVVAELKQRSFDVAGISAYCTQYKYAKWLASAVKKIGDVPVVLGGPLPTFSSKLVLEKNPAVDVCVISEAEETFPDLLNHLDDPGRVKGIAYRVDGQVVTTETRPYIKDLDGIPFPSRHKFDVETYITHASRLPGVVEQRGLNIIAGRGCPYKCHFCSKTFAGIRIRSVENIVSEIQELIDKYGVNSLLFNDELVLVGNKRGHEICEALRPLKVSWGCQGRINVMDKDLLKAMKAAGCKYVGYGIESGSPKILKLMNKRLDIDKAVNIINDTNEIGIHPIVQMMYGYLGENDRTIEETAHFYRRIDMWPEGFFLTTPLPGTALYDQIISEGRVEDEEQYILGLDSGYNNVVDQVVNLTDFADSELLAKKAQLERSLKLAYFRRHPAFLVSKVYGRLKRKLFATPNPTDRKSLATTG
ncbi:MAG: radical SAM protein [Actinomycetota bacterium]|nr:radical SAM protein [Actinomycetota bacterium]